ncbi:MAG TPA: hypothetical protein VFG38_06095, partial [Pseudomonadales bacterium]|nr:hypothetical protein [Pseudomonadales bacterium]
MATRFAIFTSALLALGSICACATHTSGACTGDPEALGYREGSLGQHECASALSSDSRSAYERGWG